MYIESWEQWARDVQNLIEYHGYRERLPHQAFYFVA